MLAQVRGAFSCGRQVAVRHAVRQAVSVHRRHRHHHHLGGVRSSSIAADESHHDPSLSADENLAAVLQRLNVASLPPAPPLGGLYVPVVRTGNYVYVSGQPPLDGEGNKITGVCVRPDDVDAGKSAALWNGLTMLATLKAELGSLNQIKRLVKSLGMVNSAHGFDQQPAVINGYSELMRDVFGAEAGVGARSAVGMILPHNIATEIEAIWELHDDA